MFSANVVDAAPPPGNGGVSVGTDRFVGRGLDGYLMHRTVGFPIFVNFGPDGSS